jgi:hypothetical protein
LLLDVLLERVLHRLVALPAAARGHAELDPQRAAVDQRHP